VDMTVFISHSSRDAAAVGSLVQHLTAARHWAGGVSGSHQRPQQESWVDFSTSMRAVHARF
jgi:hypothetical protein